MMLIVFIFNLLKKYKEHGFDDKQYVRVPIDAKNEKNEPAFKTNRIIKRLEY